MKIKKHLALLSLVLSSLALAACGGETGGGFREIPGWDDTKQNVVFYTWGSREENVLLQNVIDNFNAKEGNENINVIIVKAGNDYYGDL